MIHAISLMHALVRTQCSSFGGEVHYNRPYILEFDVWKSNSFAVSRTQYSSKPGCKFLNGIAACLHLQIYHLVHLQSSIRTEALYLILM